MFGQIKQARGFRQFLLRGVEKVANEWGLVCLAHNIWKLAQGRTPSLPHSQPAELRHLGNGATKRWPQASTFTSNRMREFAASGSPTGLSGSNPSSPGLSRQAPRDRRIDDECRSLADRDDVVEALFIRICRWIAIERVTRDFVQHLLGLQDPNVGLTRRLGPGYHDWPL